MTPLRPALRASLPGPARVWCTALAALLAAAALAQGLTPTWRLQADQARQQQQQLLSRQQAQGRAGAAVAAVASDAQRLAGGLPAADRANQRVADLLDRARQLGLGLHSIHQRWGSPGNGDAAGLLPLQVNLRLQGAYPQLRTFVAQALQHDDGLALQALHLEAATGPLAPGAAGLPAPGSAGLRADLQWSLLMRAPAPSTP